MCYYDNYTYVCNDWKWGNFRQHCQKEYRTGETCGLKMVAQTIPIAEKCSWCEKIERKKRRKDKQVADYTRWSQSPDAAKYRFSIQKALEEIKALTAEIQQLMAEKDAKYRMIGNSRRA